MNRRRNSSIGRSNGTHTKNMKTGATVHLEKMEPSQVHLTRRGGEEKGEKRFRDCKARETEIRRTA